MTTPHERLVGYLASTGWIPPTEAGPAGGLWRHPDSDLRLPVPDGVVEGGLDWQRITERLAQVENADIADVLARLDGLFVDIANLSAVNSVVIRDTIPYLGALALVREGWTMLRSSATTSLGARQHIRRFRPAADAIIETARMAHTRQGSFVIPLYLPLPDSTGTGAEPETLAGTVQGVPESQERRVMRTFAESLSAIDEIVVQPEKEPKKDSLHDLVRSGVSHEFTASLHRVLTEDAVAEFSAGFVWAPAGSPAPRDLDRVTIPAAARERVKTVATWLKSEPATRNTEYLTGPIVGVHRDEDTQNGTVTVQVSRNARLANVTVNVSRERLVEALDWMKAHETVYVESRVRRHSHGLIADRRDSVATMKSQHLNLP